MECAVDDSLTASTQTITLYKIKIHAYANEWQLSNFQQDSIYSINQTHLILMVLCWVRIAANKITEKDNN